MRKLVTFCLTVLSLCSFGQIDNRFDESKQLHVEARELLLQGKYENAILKLDSSISLMSYGTEVYHERGYAKMQLGNFNGAISDFNIIINKADYKYEAILNRGICYFELGDFVSAQNDFNRVLSLDPDNTRANGYLAQSNSLIGGGSGQEQADVTINIYSRESLYQQRRRNEELVWGTVIPLVFWTTVFLTW